jgi:hypothetical protein
MLHLRLNVDVKCPRHPGRKYPKIDSRCGLCAGLSSIAMQARELEGHIDVASRVGAEVSWEGRNCHSSSREPGATRTSSPQHRSLATGRVQQARPKEES